MRIAEAIAMAIFVAALLADDGLTLRGVAAEGIGAEGNPIIRAILQEHGPAGLRLLSAFEVGLGLLALTPWHPLARLFGLAWCLMGAGTHIWGAVTWLR